MIEEQQKAILQQKVSYLNRDLANIRSKVSNLTSITDTTLSEVYVRLNRLLEDLEKNKQKTLENTTNPQLKEIQTEWNSFLNNSTKEIKQTNQKILDAIEHLDKLKKHTEAPHAKPSIHQSSKPLTRDQILFDTN